MAETLVRSPAAAATEYFRNRVGRLVYVAGYVLDDAEATADANPPHYRQLFQELATASADHTVRLPFDIWRHSFVNDGDDDLARSTYAKLWPEPCQPLIEPLDLKKFYSLSIPKSYILGQDDIVQPEGAEWGWRPDSPADSARTGSSIWAAATR
jgi:hypothetical protein